jgi:hypothetical protein
MGGEELEICRVSKRDRGGRKIPFAVKLHAGTRPSFESRIAAVEDTLQAITQIDPLLPSPIFVALLLVE